jgi:hypothetical protein
MIKRKANAQSHIHLQFASATTQAQNCKRVCLANAHFRTSIKTSEDQAGRGKPVYNNV